MQSEQQQVHQVPPLITTAQAARYGRFPQQTNACLFAPLVRQHGELVCKESLKLLLPSILKATPLGGIAGQGAVGGAVSGVAAHACGRQGGAWLWGRPLARPACSNRASHGCRRKAWQRAPLHAMHMAS